MLFRSGAKRLLSEFADNGRKLRSIDSLLKRIRKMGIIVRQPGAVERVRRIAVEDLVLSDKYKPKRRRSDRKISHATAILRSSLHRIIHRDLQLKQTTSCSAVV